ncbi:gp53-like domain-containing protein, partial [Pantoea sp. USHLN256]
FLANLGLGEAAKRSVGTGANQIPDMSSFPAQRGGAWYRQHPSGMIEQGGSFSVSGASGAQKVTVNFPIPFPSVCVGIWFTYQTEDPSSRFVGVFTKSASSFVASIVCSTANTIYYRAEGY